MLHEVAGDTEVAAWWGDRGRLQSPLFTAGVEVREMMFWVPQTGSIGLGLSILSYNGRVHFGVIGDRKRVRDPDAIVQRFAGEFEKLLLIVLMGGSSFR